MARWPTTWIEAAMTALVTWETYDRDVQAWGVLDAVVPLILKPKPTTEEEPPMNETTTTAELKAAAPTPLLGRVSALESRADQAALELEQLWGHINDLHKLLGIEPAEPLL